MLCNQHLDLKMRKLRRKKARKYYLFGTEEGGSLFSSPLLGCCYCSVTQSCLTLCDPMDCSPPGSSVHRIFQARVLEWGAIAFSDDYASTYNFM